MMLASTSSGDRSPHGIQSFSRGLGNFLRHVEFQQHDHVASSPTSLPWKATLSQFNGLTGIGKSGDLDGQWFSVEVFQLNGCSKDQISVAQWEGHDQIRTGPLKPNVLFDLEFNEQITGFTHALWSRFPFPRIRIRVPSSAPSRNGKPKRARFEFLTTA